VTTALLYLLVRMREERNNTTKTVSPPPTQHNTHYMRQVKMKPEYSDQTANLDVCIVGGYYGDGTRRAGLLSHFLLAVADQATLPEDGSAPQGGVDLTRWSLPFSPLIRCCFSRLSHPHSRFFFFFFLFCLLLSFFIPRSITTLPAGTHWEKWGQVTGCPKCKS
jgi:hypothetical protein